MGEDDRVDVVGLDAGCRQGVLQPPRRRPEHFVGSNAAVEKDQLVAGANRRISLAKNYLKDFGISAVCGFGRENPRELGDILDLHKTAAGRL
jgi:hypothetical protein